MTRYAFRYGKWKLAVGGVSCIEHAASFNCSMPQLYDMSVDWAENHDVSVQHPKIFAAIQQNFTTWYNSVHDSISNESKCPDKDHHVPDAPELSPSPTPSSACSFTGGENVAGVDIAMGHVESKEACCGACAAHKGCGGADFRSGSRMRPTWDGKTEGGTCRLKAKYSGRYTGSQTQTSIQLAGSGL